MRCYQVLRRKYLGFVASAKMFTWDEKQEGRGNRMITFSLRQGQRGGWWQRELCERGLAEALFSTSILVFTLSVILN